jgi:2-polyprenyl-3-methyl-5-hydroxy-6-metoxy-1,4-benzoquinol methylase
MSVTMTTADEARQNHDEGTPSLTQDDASSPDAFVGRLFETLIGANELLTIYMGQQLGLYRALADLGVTTPTQLATRTGGNERYTREWLEQQAVAGFLAVEDPQVEPSMRSYSLPPGHAEVLLAQDSPHYAAAIPRALVSFAATVPAVIEAFRTGGGVPFSAYGMDIHEVQAELNRPMYVNLLGSAWLPAIPDVHSRLQADPPARVADIACGGGWSSIALARAYPKIQMDGFDIHQPSIDLARRNASEAGLADRLDFYVHDAAKPIPTGSYELVTIFEALHDLSRPVDVLRVIRSLLAPDGVAIVADERVPDQFTAPGTEMDRLFYTSSVLHCLPIGMSEQPSAGTGTVMRSTTLEGYARQAGFQAVEILPIDNPVWRFYRLVV